MQVHPIKTHKITTADKDLLKIIDQYIKNFKNGSILVIASKIVAITQGRVKKLTPEQKEALIKKEADQFIDKKHNKHGLIVTIKDNYLTYSSGIDESNANGCAVLWPKDPQKVANQVRSYLKKRFHVNKVGVIITDMAAIPLKWGVIGGAIAYSGFNPLKDLTGKPDIFGRKFKYTKVGILNGLAATAAVVMGEGSEQTPLGIIQNVSFVQFHSRNPTKKELKDLIIKPDEDLYGPMLTSASWLKGGT